MRTNRAIWLDGAPASALPLPDRGLDFGDGLFETLLLQHGKPQYRELHLQRLQLGLRTLEFPDCLQSVRDQLEQAAREVQIYGWRWSALRLTITRGEGPRGYAPPAVTVPRILVTAVELASDCLAMPTPARLVESSWRWSSQPALAGIKHLNRLEQVMAAGQCRRAGADEAVMLDHEGHVVSVTAGNIFMVVGTHLYTPMLGDCGIAGTRRRLVMERWSAQLGLPASEAAISGADLHQADEVFYSNSLLGLRPVACLGEREWAQHPVCESIHALYRGEQI